MESQRATLVSASVTVDDSALRRYLQSVVDGMTDRIRSEVEALTKSVAEIRTSLDSVWEEVQANREAVLGEVRQVSEIVHSTIANRKKDASRDGAENSDMMEQQQEIVLGLRERVAKLEEGAERLARCDDLSQLEQSWQSQHDEQERRNAQLLKHLGLDYNTAYGGLIRDSTIAEAAYLSGVYELCQENSKRTSRVESAMRTKCERADMEVVNSALSDLRGRCEASVKRMDDGLQDIRDRIAKAAAETRDESKQKVNTVDLDLWKVSMNAVTARLRESMADALKTTQVLSREFEIFKATLGKKEENPQPPANNGSASELLPARLLTVEECHDPHPLPLLEQRAASPPEVTKQPLAVAAPSSPPDLARVNDPNASATTTPACSATKRLDAAQRFSRYAAPAGHPESEAWAKSPAAAPARPRSALLMRR